MPTCEPCGTFYNPNTLPEDGSCPECGGLVRTGQHGHVGEPLTRKVPWHFWVGVASICAYLVWRVIQGVVLLF